MTMSALKTGNSDGMKSGRLKEIIAANYRAIHRRRAEFWSSHEVRKRSQARLFGVSGHPIVVYFHKVQLQIIGSKDNITIEAGFTDSTSIPAHLGQADFFKQYKISFERYKEQIEIKPAHRAPAP